MRSLLAVLCVCALAAAEDFVHLENGRVLRGVVVDETPDTVTVEMGAGRITVPRDRVRLVERGATRDAPRRVTTRRDEWFLVLHRGQVVGWRRVVEVALGSRITVEERTVFFRPGGGTDVDIRQVETADARGRPLEFLLMESYGKEMEVTSGQVEADRVRVRVQRDGTTRYVDLHPETGWVLALPAWSRFLEEARPGAVRRVRALDPRRLGTVDLVLRRDSEDAAPPGDDVRPCRALSLTAGVARARALYRPGEGALHVELNGPTLVARRSTRERVELAREAHRPEAPLTVEEAQLFPFYRRPKERKAYQPRAGFSLEAPDPGWRAEVKEADTGLVLSYEKIALFSSLEVFAWPRDEATADANACLGRALARLTLTAEEATVAPEVERSQVAGLPARTVAVVARHRGEDLRCLVTVVCAKDRYLVLVGASPARWWRWAERDFRAFTQSLVLVP